MMLWSRNSWDVCLSKLLLLINSLTVSHSLNLIILSFIILIFFSAMPTSRLSNWVSLTQKKWVIAEFNTQLLNCIFSIFCLIILTVIWALITQIWIDFLNCQLLLLMLVEFDLRFEFDWSVDLCECLKESFFQQSFLRWLILLQWLHFFVTFLKFLNFLIFFSWLVCCLLFD